MKCFFCKKPIVPQNGYFRSQLFGDKILSHVECRPQFFFDNKPEEDKGQGDLFIPSPNWREQK